MTSFCFKFQDGHLEEYPAVISVTYDSTDHKSSITVPEEELLEHKFPIGRAIWLKTATRNVTVSGEGLRCIEVY